MCFYCLSNIHVALSSLKCPTITIYKIGFTKATFFFPSRSTKSLGLCNSNCTISHLTGHSTPQDKLLDETLRTYLLETFNPTSQVWVDVIGSQLEKERHFLFRFKINPFEASSYSSVGCRRHFTNI